MSGAARVALALETSVRTASIAVRSEERVAGEVLSAERAHASDLLPILEDLLKQLDTPIEALETILVGTGPGSYTGLRVGIATALGLARGTGAQLFAMPSFAVLAYGALSPGQECTVLFDARGGELYFARYARREHDVIELEEPSVLAPDELPQLPRAHPIFGDAGVARAARLDADALANLRTDAEPRAKDLLELGERRLAELGPTPPHELQPLYLRPFAARSRRR